MGESTIISPRSVGINRIGTSERIYMSATIRLLQFLKSIPCSTVQEVRGNQATMFLIGVGQLHSRVWEPLREDSSTGSVLVTFFIVRVVNTIHKNDFSHAVS